MSSIPGTRTTKAAWTTLWLAGAVVGAAYGVILVVTALRLPAGADLTGHFVGQPAVKAAMALLLAAAALTHPGLRERRWLVAALLFSAAGDVLLAIPWWEPSFVGGLAAFLVAHLCFLGALVPLITVTRSRLGVAAAVVAACVALLLWFWPALQAQELTIPVVLYMGVLAAMVCAALLAGLPTRWTALGAVCFAVSDGMIGISEFVRADQLLAVPIWWAYGAAQVLITAGFFFGRESSGLSEDSATPAK
ncbi:MAG: YhhN-like protein [Mycobacterium sp.]|nr:YhhN-like protein [Mycobacterium sp.]